MVNIKTIDAKVLSRMFLAGAKNLEAKKEWINELNVFPVPDGDTGTNMTMTIMSAAAEVSALTEPDMETLAKAISSGSLRGARGNSGVILSQLLRGFTRGVRKSNELDAITIAAAMERAVETAYKAVMKPKEGTILTVAKEAALKAAEIAPEAEELEPFFKEIFEHAEYTLSRTPEMLPVLKEAGVVDSGGQGLLEVLRGAIDGFLGKEVDYSEFEKPAGAAVTKISPQAEADIKFGYCTEFIILLNKPMPIEEEHSFKEFLTSIGDSIVLVADDEIVKVHVHTNHPGQAIERALTYGSLSRMKIDNMREEHQEKLIKDAEKLAKQQAEEEKQQTPPKETGFIAVSAGAGLTDIFRELGVDYLIEGGQTMNPSTEDMLNAIAHVNADHIFILPNNKNIIMAANQARDLTEDKEIIVIPSKTVPQGITALVNFMPDLTSQENLENMTAEMERVKTAQITYAVRTTNIDGMDIEKGDIMAIGDKGMLAVEHSPEEAAKAALKAMLDDESELVTIYYGCDVKEEDAEKLKEEAESLFPDKELELQYGGQPIYYYMISAE